MQTQAIMITSYLAHTLPTLGEASKRLNEVSPSAILPGDWPNIVAGRIMDVPEGAPSDRIADYL